MSSLTQQEARDLYLQLEEDFEPDGALRDIYAFETDLALWQKTVNDLLVSNWPTELLHDGKPATTSQAVHSIKTDTVSSLLRLDVASLKIISHFFCDDEIDFDVDDRELNRGNLIHLCHFTAFLGKSIHRNIYLTHQLNPKDGILAYSIDDDHFLALKRPPRSTSSLSKRIAVGLKPLRDLTAHLEENKPNPKLLIELKARWKPELYRPDSLDMHTELTAAQFESLRQVNGWITEDQWPEEVVWRRLVQELNRLAHSFTESSA
ncbi:hypothetical protein [Mucisphaera sp.]|uniref:hypothetical protein n=1 Tax=Mucisphaera sp. TaxID=2913024 RepID=UPI003D111A7C